MAPPVEPMLEAGSEPELEPEFKALREKTTCGGVAASNVRAIGIATPAVRAALEERFVSGGSFAYGMINATRFAGTRSGQMGTNREYRCWGTQTTAMPCRCRCNGRSTLDLPDSKDRCPDRSNSGDSMRRSRSMGCRHRRRDHRWDSSMRVWTWQRRASSCGISRRPVESIVHAMAQLSG